MRINNPTEVKQLIQDGQSPFLPFESNVLRDELGQLGVEQGELSRLLGEAMEQSSETWHDNAPADAVNSQSRILSERAEKIIAELGAGISIEYPDQEQKAVTLGSIIGIRYAGDTEVEKMLITGISRTVPTLRNEAYDGVEAVTVRSPIGAAVLGHVAGDSAAYLVNGRRLSIEIVDIEQFDPQNLAEVEFAE